MNGTLIIYPGEPYKVTFQARDDQPVLIETSLVTFGCPTLGPSGHMEACGMSWKAFFLAGIVTCNCGTGREAQLGEPFGLQLHIKE